MTKKSTYKKKKSSRPKITRRKISVKKSTKGKKREVKGKALGLSKKKGKAEVFKGLGIIVEKTEDKIVLKKRSKAAEKAAETKERLTIVGTEMPDIPPGLYKPKAIIYYPKEELEKMHDSRKEPGKTRDEEHIAKQKELKAWLESGGKGGDFLMIDRPKKKKS